MVQNNSSLENKFLEAMQILVDQGVKDAGYDKTIQATIISCVDSLQGKYKIKYQGNGLYAYATNLDEQYKEGTSVYVLVPGNDFAKTKTILGTVSKTGINLNNTVNIGDYYEQITVNCITQTDTIGYKSYGLMSDVLGQSLETNYLRIIYAYGADTKNNATQSNQVHLGKENDKEVVYTLNSDFKNQVVIDQKEFVKTLKSNRNGFPGDAFIFGAKMTTNIDSYQLRGNFGISLILAFATDKVNEYKYTPYTLDVSKMDGDPYHNVIGVPQRIYSQDGDLDVTKLDHIEAIIFFDKGFHNAQWYKDQYIPTSSTADVDKAISADIWISDLCLYGARILDEPSTGTLNVVIDVSPSHYFKIGMDDSDKTVNDIVCKARVEKNGLPQTLSKAHYYWFAETPDAEPDEYYSIAGPGWQIYYGAPQQILQPDGSTTTIPMPIDSPTWTIHSGEVRTEERRFKCVVVYEGPGEEMASIEGIVTLWNNNPDYIIGITASKETFSSAGETSELECNVKAVNGPEKNYVYKWNRLLYGRYETVEPIKEQKKVICNSNDFTDTITYFCSVYEAAVDDNSSPVYIGNTYKELSYATGDTERYDIIINNIPGAYIYDLYGNSPTQVQEKGNSLICKDLSFRVKDLALNQDVEVYEPQWYVLAKEQDRLIIPNADKNTIKYANDRFEICGLDEATYIYYSGKTFSYTLAPKYDTNKTNGNYVILRVRYQDTYLYKRIDIPCYKVGDPGVNSSHHFLKIKTSKGNTHNRFWVHYQNADPDAASITALKDVLKLQCEQEYKSKALRSKIADCEDDDAKKPYQAILNSFSDKKTSNSYVNRINTKIQEYTQSFESNNFVYAFCSQGTWTADDTGECRFGGQWFEAELYKDGEKLYDSAVKGSKGKIIKDDPASYELNWEILTPPVKPAAKEAIADTYSNIHLKDEDKNFVLHPTPYTELPYAHNIVKTTLTVSEDVQKNPSSEETTKITSHYYTYSPIVTIHDLSNKRIEFVDNSGFQYFKYANDGKSPEFDKNSPFEIRVYDGNKDISTLPGMVYIWSTCGMYFDDSKFSSTGSSKELAAEKANLFTLTQVRHTEYDDEAEDEEEISYTVLDKNKIAVAANDKMFDGSCTSLGIQCVIGYTTNEDETNSLDATADLHFEPIGIVHIPIYGYLNTSGFGALNDWDGTSVEINPGKDGDGYILAPQIGAGKKNDQGQFTGILMGSLKDYTKDTPVMYDGLLGFSNGQRSIFLDANTGNAEFGLTQSKIIFDVAHGDCSITGGGYHDNHSKGMLIDLEHPTIKYGNGNFEVKENGSLHCKEFYLDNKEEPHDQDDEEKYTAVQITPGRVFYSTYDPDAQAGSSIDSANNRFYFYKKGVTSSSAEDEDEEEEYDDDKTTNPSLPENQSKPTESKPNNTDANFEGDDANNPVVQGKAQGIFYSNGNLVITGKLQAAVGVIGGWRIKSNRIESINGRLKLYGNGRIVGYMNTALESYDDDAVMRIQGPSLRSGTVVTYSGITKTQYQQLVNKNESDNVSYSWKCTNKDAQIGDLKVRTTKTRYEADASGNLSLTAEGNITIAPEGDLTLFGHFGISVGTEEAALSISRVDYLYYYPDPDKHTGDKESKNDNNNNNNNTDTNTGAGISSNEQPKNVKVEERELHGTSFYTPVLINNDDDSTSGIVGQEEDYDLYLTNATKTKYITLVEITTRSDSDTTPRTQYCLRAYDPTNPELSENNPNLPTINEIIKSNQIDKYLIKVTVETDGEGKEKITALSFKGDALGTSKEEEPIKADDTDEEKARKLEEQRQRRALQKLIAVAQDPEKYSWAPLRRTVASNMVSDDIALIRNNLFLDDNGGTGIYNPEVNRTEAEQGFNPVLRTMHQDLVGAINELATHPVKATMTDKGNEIIIDELWEYYKWDENNKPNVLVKKGQNTKYTSTNPWDGKPDGYLTKRYTITVENRGKSNEEVTQIKFPDQSVMTLEGFFMNGGFING